MKIWHEKLFPYLSNKLIWKLYSDCCNMRGLGWNKRRTGIEYIYDAGKSLFVIYHLMLIDEMELRGLNDNYRLASWKINNYCGKHLGYEDPHDKDIISLKRECKNRGYIYAEHSNKKLLSDIIELKAFGIYLPELELKTIICGENYD